MRGKEGRKSGEMWEGKVKEGKMERTKKGGREGNEKEGRKGEKREIGKD